MTKKICEHCKKSQGRFPVYDDSTGGYLNLCQKDARKFIESKGFKYGKY